MALVSLNVESDDAVATTYDPSLCIYLSEDQCEALGITTPPAAGTVVMLRARAMFESVTQTAMDADGDKDVRVSLRITDMELGSESTGSSASLYD